MSEGPDARREYLPQKSATIKTAAGGWWRRAGPRTNAMGDGTVTTPESGQVVERGCSADRIREAS